MQRMFELFPRLKERRNQRAMTMSGGEQQMLAIARR
jgi:branched-chain amino acid transport system ATP-binding protein